jgi:hypothetical protein
MTSTPNFYASEMFQVKLPTIVNGMCHLIHLPIHQSLPYPFISRSYWSFR